MTYGQHIYLSSESLYDMDIDWDTRPGSSLWWEQIGLCRTGG
jgi:hypothetical protein